MDRTPRRSKLTPTQSQLGSGTRKPIITQSLERQVASSTQDDSTSIHAATPARSSKGSASKPASHDGKMASLPSRPSASRHGFDTTPSSNHHHPPISHRTPKTHTPKKFDWTIDKLEEALRSFSTEIGTDGAKLTARLVRMSWKKDAPERRFISKKDWFADMKRTPVEGVGKSADTMRIRTKVCPIVL